PCLLVSLHEFHCVWRDGNLVDRVNRDVVRLEGGADRSQLGLHRRYAGVVALRVGWRRDEFGCFDAERVGQPGDEARSDSALVGLPTVDRLPRRADGLCELGLIEAGAYAGGP